MFYSSVKWDSKNKYSFFFFPDMYDYDNVLRPDTRAFRADYHKLSFYSSGARRNICGLQVVHNTSRATNL